MKCPRRWHSHGTLSIVSDSQFLEELLSIGEMPPIYRVVRKNKPIPEYQ